MHLSCIRYYVALIITMQYLGMTCVTVSLDIATGCERAAEKLLDSGFESERLSMTVTRSQGILLSSRSTKNCLRASRKHCEVQVSDLQLLCYVGRDCYLHTPQIFF